MDIAFTDLRAVFDAADALLSAREAQMVTRQDWEELDRAVSVARESTADRTETFVVEEDHLVRRVIPTDGVPYERRCPFRSFEAIARAVAHHGATPFILDDLCTRAGVSRSRGLVAMVFLKTRGRINKARSFKHVAARGFSVEAALGDYHALAARA